MNFTTRFEIDDASALKEIKYFIDRPSISACFSMKEMVIETPIKRSLSIRISPILERWRFGKHSLISSLSLSLFFYAMRNYEIFDTCCDV